MTDFNKIRQDTIERIDLEVNSGECKLESNPSAIIRGYHIWWCTVHSQPWAWCEKTPAKRIAVEYAQRLAQLKEDLSTLFVAEEHHFKEKVKE